MTKLDPRIHQPTRLRIMMVLSGVESADFRFLRSALGLTEGNLSAHTMKLEQGKYLEISKTFEGKTPNTTYRLTQLGRERLAEYWRALDEIRGLVASDRPVETE